MRSAYLIPTLCIVVSCGGEHKSDGGVAYGGHQEAYERNLQKWSELGLVNYRFNSSFDWYCNESDPRAVTHIVEAGKPTSDNGYAIEDIFILIAQKIELKAYKLEVEYDETYGVPLKVEYNDYYSIEDDAWCMVISNFEPGANSN